MKRRPDRDRVQNLYTHGTALPRYKQVYRDALQNTRPLSDRLLAPIIVKNNRNALHVITSKGEPGEFSYQKPHLCHCV